MKARVFDSGFVIVFLLMLTAPLVCIDMSSDRVSVRENRKLAKRPKLTEVNTKPVKFIREFDAWFKDHTGFRENLIGLYNVVNNNGLLHGRYKEGQVIMLVGRQGHRYFADVNGRLIPKYQGKAVFSDEALRDFAANLQKIKDYLNEKNIPLVVMFCADKETIYPEYYPTSIKYGGEPVQLDVITQYLQNNTTVDVFNIRRALLAEKENYLLYAKTFGDLAHYNQIGAFFAYRELMKHINQYFPEITSFTIDDVTIAVDDKGIAEVSLKEETAYKQLDASFFDDVNVIKPFSTECIAFENKNTMYPVILFLRDSYANEFYFTKYIANQFGKTIMIHYENMEHLDEYITTYNPDIMVFESAERTLEWFASFIAAFRLP